MSNLPNGRERALVLTKLEEASFFAHAAIARPPSLTPSHPRRTMTSITLTAGPKNATTDPETGLRYYDWKGRKLPSSTSLRRMAGLPFRLHQWTISKVVERAVLENQILAPMLDRPASPRERVRDKNVAKEASRWLRSAATEERDAPLSWAHSSMTTPCRQVPAQSWPTRTPSPSCSSSTTGWRRVGATSSPPRSRSST